MVRITPTVHHILLVLTFARYPLSTKHQSMKDLCKEIQFLKICTNIFTYSGTTRLMALPQNFTTPLGICQILWSSQSYLDII